MILPWLGRAKNRRLPRLQDGYDTLELDLQWIHETRRFGRDGILVATDRAVAAAERLFDHRDWQGLHAEHVQALLGTPTCRSRIPWASEKWTYRFDNGFRGHLYTLKFQDGVVNSVSIEPIA